MFRKCIIMMLKKKTYIISKLVTVEENGKLKILSKQFQYEDEIKVPNIYSTSK